MNLVMRRAEFLLHLQFWGAGGERSVREWCNRGRRWWGKVGRWKKKGTHGAALSSVAIVQDAWDCAGGSRSRRRGSGSGEGFWILRKKMEVEVQVEVEKSGRRGSIRASVF